MKNKIVLFCAGSALALVVSGCLSPQLAQTPYGEKEQRWAKYLKNAYPEWEPPKTYPSIIGLEEAEKSEETASISGNKLDIDAIDQIVNQLSDEVNIDETPTDTISTPPAMPVDVVTPVTVEEPVDVVEPSQEYTVQKSDSLWGIATKFYQDGTKWKLIQEANPDKLSDPKKLKPGMSLKIPTL